MAKQDHSGIFQNSKAPIPGEPDMADAFLQGKVIQGVCFGYRLIPVVDGENQPVIDSDGKVQKIREIVPEEAEIIRTVFQSVVAGNRPRTEIARELNERKAGSGRWDHS